MIKLLSVTSFFVLVSFQCIAQNIKRKGGLGVAYYQTTPDSLIKKLEYKQGAIVQFSLPNTTAASLGLQRNDIVTKINSKVITTPSQLALAAKNLREDDTIEVLIIRNKQETVLKGTVIAKPKETSTTADVVYGEFAYKNGYVRTIYKKLKGKSPIGTIYFLQGLPCYSMDNFSALDKTKQALDAMVDRGFAVYRMEKADMGDNTNQAPCETMGYNEELEMYIAGYKNLLTLKQVDTTKLFLFGHSMGGVTAPLLAEKFQPKGVVVYGTVFKPWLVYLLDANFLQPQLYGEYPVKLRKALDDAKPYINDYFFTNKSVEEICKKEEGLAAMQLILGYNPQTKLGASGRAALVHKELNQHNLTNAWGNTNSYVLAIYGESDIPANNADDHIALINYINKIHPGKGQFWQAPGTTHTFEEIGTMKDYIKWQSNQAAYLQYAATKFNPKVFDYACNWMKQVLEKNTK